MGLEGLFSRPPTPLNGLWDPHRVCPNNTDAGPTVKQGQEGHDGTGVAGGTGGTGCPEDGAFGSQELGVQGGNAKSPILV